MTKPSKSGLPANCNLADMFLKPKVSEPEVQESPAITNIASDSPLIEEVAPVAIEAPEKPIKPTKTKKPMTWKQTGISLSESVIMRLKLESFKSGKTLSEVADSILAKGLPNHKISA